MFEDDFLDQWLLFINTKEQSNKNINLMFCCIVYNIYPPEGNFWPFSWRMIHCVCHMLTTREVNWPSRIRKHCIWLLNEANESREIGFALSSCYLQHKWLKVISHYTETPWSLLTSHQLMPMALFDKLWYRHVWWSSKH